jgi:hypothetical protein
MEKKTTLVAQPDKTETNKTGIIASPIIHQKMYRDHSHNNHLHGRVNKFPFGSSHGPSAF